MLVYGDNRCSLEFDTRTGTFSISSGGERIFSGAIGRVIVRKKKRLEQLGTPPSVLPQGGGGWSNLRGSVLEADGGGVGGALF